jgi:hypothetical protein
MVSGTSTNANDDFLGCDVHQRQATTHQLYPRRPAKGTGGEGPGRFPISWGSFFRGRFAHEKAPGRGARAPRLRREGYPALHRRPGTERSYDHRQGQHIGRLVRSRGLEPPPCYLLAPQAGASGAVIVNKEASQVVRPTRLFSGYKATERRDFVSPNKGRGCVKRIAARLVPITTVLHS